MMLLLLLMLLPTTATSSSDEKPGCQETCGNVSVPYPFGIGDRNCALNNYFFLNCSSSSDGHPELWFGRNLPVRNISVSEGTITLSSYTAFDCYNKLGIRNYYFSQYIILGSGPFMLSGSRNIFAVIGCDTSAQVTNYEYTYGTSCLSLCSQYVNMSDKNVCSGFGCCQTSFPEGLKSVRYSVSSFYNYTNVSDFNSCGFAFLVDERSFKISDWPLSRMANGKDMMDVVVEWVVENQTCKEAKANTSAYACGINTNCTYSENPPGYRCLCDDGFEGNPYLQQGCQDIDECQYPEKYPCKGTCKNTIGDYECQCPYGMHGDGKTGCQGAGIITIIAAIGGTVLCVIICILLYVIWTKIRKDKNFRENGGMVLKNQRVRIFTKAELAKATKNYDDDRKLGEGGFGSVYKGVLADDTVVAVKKFKSVDKAQMNDFQREICIVSQVNHKNVVKLLGLCLETKMPLLVYEFISNGTLSKHIHDRSSQILASWSNRLRVAYETALALDYLHSLADPPVIHGDVKSVNILLDDNYTAKVADFGASVLVSPGQTNIIASKIQGTFGYLDPEYLMTGKLTTESDVYSFGVVLLEILTGEKPNSNDDVSSSEKRNIIQYFTSAMENNHLYRILGFRAANESELDEIEAVAELAKRCVNSSGINRPTMKEVSEELGRLKALREHSWAQQNSYETDRLLGESSPSFHMNASRPMIQSQIVVPFQIEDYSDSI